MSYDLFELCKKENLEELQNLIENFGFNVNHTDPYHFSILHAASQTGQLKVVKYLIEAGANINAMNSHGYSIFTYACLGGNLEVVKYLVEEAGANIKLAENYERDALYFTSRGGSIEVLQYLIEDLKFNVNAVIDSGMNALHYASNRGNFEAAQYLIERAGADINAADKSLGKTALHWACKGMYSKGRYYEIIEYLVEEAGADINITNNDGKTVLQILEKDLRENALNPKYYQEYYILKSTDIGQKLFAQLELTEEETAFRETADYSSKFFNNRLSKIIAEKKFLMEELSEEEDAFLKTADYNPKFKVKYEQMREEMQVFGEHLRVKKTEGGYKWNSELQKIEGEVSQIEPQSLKEFDFPEDATNVMANFLTTRDAQKIPLLSYSIAKDLGKIKPRNIVEAYKDTKGNLHDGKGAISSRWIPVKALKTPDGELIEVNSDQNIDERYVDMQMHSAVHMGANGQYQIHSDASPQDRRIAQENIETKLENQQLEEESRHEVSEPKNYPETNNEESLPLPGDLDPLSLSHHI